MWTLVNTLKNPDKGWHMALSELYKHQKRNVQGIFCINYPLLYGAPLLKSWIYTGYRIILWTVKVKGYGSVF